jgi:hypothetical protein
MTNIQSNVDFKNNKMGEGGPEISMAVFEHKPFPLF